MWQWRFGEEKAPSILEVLQELERLVEYVETAQFIDLCATFLYVLRPPDDPKTM